MRGVCAVFLALFLVLVMVETTHATKRLREALTAPERHLPEWEPER